MNDLEIIAELSVAIAGFAAVIPLGFGYLQIAESDMPRYASIFLTIVLVTQVTLIAPGFFQLSVSSRSKLGKRFFYSIFPFVVAMTVVQLANAVGAFHEKSFGIFFYGLVMMLLVASAQFVVSILDSSRREL